MADDIIAINIEVRGKKSVIDAEKALNTMQKQLLNVAIAQNKGTLAEGSLRKARVESQRALMKKGVSLGQATKASWQYVKALEAMTAEQLQFAKSQQAGSRGMNKFGMYAQQVGYQVGDFFVQVQSGTSALVAFGQQGTQLAGLLPGVYGAVVGIGLSIGTMLLRTFLDTKDAGKQLEESIKGVENALSNLSNVSSMLRDTLGAPFSEANTQLKEYLELLEKSSAAKVQDAIALAFGTKGESTGILNELKVLADDMTNIPFYQIEWLRDLVGVQYGPTSEEIANAEDILRVREEIAEILRGTAAQPRIIEGAEGLRELGDDLLAYSKKFNGALGERIRTLMFEAGLTQLMVDAEKAKGNAADATTKKQLALIDDLLNAAEKSEAATNANLDAQLALLMKQYEEQLKIDAIADKTLDTLINQEKIIELQLKHGNDSVQVEEKKAEIARAAFEEALEKQEVEDEILTAIMLQYDTVQSLLASNKKLTTEKAAQLALDQRSLSISGQQRTGTLTLYGGRGAMTPAQKALEKRNTEEDKKTRAAKPTTMEGPIKALERQIELSKALFGLEGDARREQEVYMQLKFQNQDADIKAKESQLRSLSELVAEEERRTRVFEEQREVQKEVADTIANSMGDALMSMVDGTKSVKDAFKSMAADIIKDLYRIYVVKQITGMISGAIMGPAAAGGYFGPAGGVGGGYGATIAYADGGVVGSPTTFPMSAGRTGLMGEAGPEAIMPLKRGKDGKLGVQAEGGAGDVIIHQNFNFQANGDESVKKIIAQQAPAIANMTKKQILDDRRRGGQMKQAFG